MKSHWYKALDNIFPANASYNKVYISFRFLSVIWWLSFWVHVNMRKNRRYEIKNKYLHFLVIDLPLLPCFTLSWIFYGPKYWWNDWFCIWPHLTFKESWRTYQKFHLVYISLYYLLDGIATYRGLFLAPAEGYGFWQRLINFFWIYSPFWWQC